MFHCMDMGDSRQIILPYESINMLCFEFNCKRPSRATAYWNKLNEYVMVMFCRHIASFLKQILKVLISNFEFLIESKSGRIDAISLSNGLLKASRISLLVYEYIGSMQRSELPDRLQSVEGPMQAQIIWSILVDNVFPCQT